jgi:adenylate cyclase
VLFAVVYYAVGQIAKAEAVAELEYQRSEKLLENILPRSVVQRLKLRPDQIIADRINEASVLSLNVGAQQRWQATGDGSMVVGGVLIMRR